jgi:hypothetical protein
MTRFAAIHRDVRCGAVAAGLFLAAGVEAQQASSSSRSNHGDSTQWRGTLHTPDGRTLAITADVVGAAERVQLTINAPGPGGRIERFPTRNVDFTGRTLRFVFEPRGPVQCELGIAKDGGYEGPCRNDSGPEGTIVLQPRVSGMLLPAHEVALALSAAPAHIAQSADVYVLAATGYIRVRQGTNGFACLIERPRPPDIWPVCFDPEGVRSIMPVAVLRGRLRSTGATEAAIADSVAEGFRSGTFRAASRTGVAYMLSPHGRSLNASNGQIIELGPHLMFYAPYVQRADVGFSTSDTGVGSITIQSPGTPHAYITVRLMDGTCVRP